jgi:hypothetical protein
MRKDFDATEVGTDTLAGVIPEEIPMNAWACVRNPVKAAEIYIMFVQPMGNGAWGRSIRDSGSMLQVPYIGEPR